MIPFPPPDPALRGMEVALDGAAMREVLARTQKLAGIRSCRPYYVKYKPGRYCVVQYELEPARDGEAPARPAQAHAVLHPRKRLEKIRARLGSGPEPQEAIFLDEPGAIAQLYPEDLDLPGLGEAAQPESISARLRTLPGLAASGLRCSEVRLVRYKARKRAVLRYDLEGVPIAAVYGKLRKDGGGALPRLAHAFAGAGIATPEVLGSFEDLGMVVQKEGPGTRLKDLRCDAVYEKWMAPVAETLAALHNSGMAGLRPGPSEGAAPSTSLQEAADVAGTLLPRLAGEADRLVFRLRRAFAGLEESHCTIHGSFHDDQVLVGRDGVVIVDIDSATVGNPLSDVGHFLSYLSGAGAGEAHDRFAEAYRAARPDAGADVDLFEAASLLRWATLPFRELRSDWPEAVEQRVRRAGELLDGYEKRRNVRTSAGVTS